MYSMRKMASEQHCGGKKENGEDRSEWAPKALQPEQKLWDICQTCPHQVRAPQLYFDCGGGSDVCRRLSGDGVAGGAPE